MENSLKESIINVKNGGNNGAGSSYGPYYGPYVGKPFLPSGSLVYGER